MALEYKVLIGIEDIMPVLDEHVRWYGRLLQSYFEGKPLMDPAPSVFREWNDKARAENKISIDVSDKLCRIHDGLIEAANAFTVRFDMRETPPLKEFNEVTGHYEEFIQSMRQIELDQMLENSGYDDKTGLRSVKVLPADFSREMERRARRGNPFALALVKINNYKEEWQKDADIHADMIRKIAEQLKACLRSFDDAYYMGDEYFMLALKHADGLGAQAAMVRLNQAITAAHIVVPGEPLNEISVSTVLSEPTEGDALDTLILHMKKDLEGINSKGTVLQYQDLSPLQRYIHSMGSDK